jgi:stage II sporulation protein D
MMRSRRIISLVSLVILILSAGRTAQTLHAQNFQAQNFYPRDPRAPQVQIGVFTLFHPQQLTLSPSPGGALALEADSQVFILDSSAEASTARITFFEDKVRVAIGTRTTIASEICAHSRDSAAADFILSVPQKISRHYRGTLQIHARSGSLVPVISMDLETAVASAVQAESPPDAALEALKAQAVASRSYFVMGSGRHQDFDFCDTTHCQFLREPPAENSPAWIAASQTRGLVLTYREQPFAAMFSRSCGGRTRTPQEIGLPAGSYPYFSVSCKYCREHPKHWQARLSQAEIEALQHAGEAGRLDLDRQLGWSAVPSNDFIAKKEGSSVVLEGVGQGHGVGLCQLGAKAMAEAGANFRDILEHYYPNSSLREVSTLRINAQKYSARSAGN